MSYGGAPFAVTPYALGFSPKPVGPPDVTVVAVLYPRFLNATTYTRLVDGLGYAREVEAVSYT